MSLRILTWGDDYQGDLLIQAQVSLWERGRGRYDTHRRGEGKVTAHAEMRGVV